MLEYITGKISEKRPTYVVLETGGFGYRVNIPISTYNKIGKVGEPAKLLTSPHIREDSWTLYGFASDEERTLFNLLLTVSGVGPKSAIAALSALSPYQLKSALASNDADKLTLIPGIGKKTAQRMTLELKDKIKALPGEISETFPLEKEFQEALRALEALGFNRLQAEKAVEAVREVGDGESTVQLTEDIIRKALARITGK